MFFSLSLKNNLKTLRKFCALELFLTLTSITDHSLSSKTFSPSCVLVTIFSHAYTLIPYNGIRQTERTSAIQCEESPLCPRDFFYRLTKIMHMSFAFACSSHVRVDCNPLSDIESLDISRTFVSTLVELWSPSPDTLVELWSPLPWTSYFQDLIN